MAHFDVFCGMSRTGKTTIAKRLGMKYKVKTRRTIYVFDPSGKLNSIADVVIRDMEHLEEIYPKERSQKVKGAVFIFDDYRLLFKGNSIVGSAIHRIVVDYNNMNNHLIFCCHSLDDVVTDVAKFCQRYWVFTNISSIDHVKKKVSGGWQVFWKVTQKVNDFTKKYGKILSKEGKKVRKIGTKTEVQNPIFPFAIVYPQESTYKFYLTKPLKEI